jgi:hypothetical protein
MIPGHNELRVHWPSYRAIRRPIRPISGQEKVETLEYRQQDKDWDEPTASPCANHRARLKIGISGMARFFYDSGRFAFALG